MPEHQLQHFFFGPELKITKILRQSKGMIWVGEKRRRGPEICPKCATPSTVRYGRVQVTIHDAPLREEQITLKVTKHRYFCKPCHKPFTEPLPGVFPRMRTTQRLRKAILKDCDEVVSLARVARRYRRSRSLVQKICYEQLERKLRERRTAQWPTVLGIDEHFFSRQKGKTEFATVFTNVGKRRMFEMSHTKDNRSIFEQIKHVPGRERVAWVVMDLSRGYRSLASALFPQARIVADKFHVLRLINPALIRARKEIHGHRQELHLRRKLLMSRHKLDYFQRSDLDRYLANHPKLEALYRAKERLSEFYRIKGSERARRALDRMTVELKRSTYEELKRLGRTLSEWKEEILEYFKTRYTNAFTEAMNGIAKLVQRRGCGYRSFKNYRIRTLSACPL